MTGYTTPRALAADDDVSHFECGEADLDDYLRTRALRNHADGASRCYVTLRDERVVGYYALATTSVLRRETAGKVRRNMPDPIPALLLTRLAVDRKEQGNNLGASLLQDAIRRSVAAADIVGIRVVLVHALTERARDFYVHAGFDDSPTDPLHLYLLLKDARALIRPPS